jgi:DNA-binding NtrC family response regulator/tetratricopeptide (TPR) repeat protein
MPDERLDAVSNQQAPPESPDQAELRREIGAETHPGRKAELLVRLGQAMMGTNPLEAKGFAEHALTLARKHDLLPLVARALCLIAEANWSRCDFAEAEAPCLESLATATRIADYYVEHRAANLLGLIARQRGESDRAIGLFEQSLRAAEKLNDDQAKARVETNLGGLERDRGASEAALVHLFRALELSEPGKGGRMLGHVHIGIGSTYGDMGDWEKAVEYFYRALVEHEKLGDKRGMAVCYLNVAEIYLKRGKHERAMEYSQWAVRCADEAQSPQFRLAGMGILGEACVLAGDYARAGTIFDENIKSAEELSLHQELGMNLRRKGELLLVTQEPGDVVELLEQALTEAERGGAQVTRASILCALGKARAGVGDWERAGMSFESAVSILKTTGKSYDLAKVHFDYGRFLVNRGQKQDGLGLVQQAAKTFRRLEAIAQSDAAERYLLQMNVEEDRRLSLLRSLTSLASHSLPLSEFAPRCLRILKDALDFGEATFVVEEGQPFHYGKPCSAEELEVCQRGELVLSDTALCLPLRLSGHNVGGIYLRWPEPVQLDLESSFWEIVSQLLSVAMERNRLQLATTPVQAMAGQTGIRLRAPRFPDFVGNSRALNEIYETIERVAPTSACVLIRGESGTGKELVARIIARNSPRSNEPFVAINCAAMPESLVESELFGIEKGVATGVVERKGKFEQAHRGTLFLDEIGDMSLVLQAKLLRVLQDRKFERVGGRKTIEVDTRIIVATNKNLEQAIAEGKFREDLYYRLNVVAITLPGLRERREDVPLLVSHFIAKYNEEFQRRIRGISNEVLEAFIAYSWPGNVRELENVVERSVILCTSDLIQVNDLPLALRRARKTEETVEAPRDARKFRKRLQRDANAVIEKSLLTAALEDAKGNVTLAARQIGISRSHFYRLLDKYEAKAEGTVKGKV